MSQLRRPAFRFYFAIAQLIVTTVLWPLTVLTSSEPFWVLNLSWFAVWQGALIMVLTTDIRKEQDEE